MAINIQSY